MKTRETLSLRHHGNLLKMTNWSRLPHQNIDEFVAEMEELASSDGTKGDTKSHGPRPDVVQVDVSGNKGSGDKSPRPSGGE